MCGSGCADAHDEVVKLAERLQAPVVHALRGKEHIEWDNPYSVGMTGLIGFSSGYQAMLNADTLILLGTQFPYRAFIPLTPISSRLILIPEVLALIAPSTWRWLAISKPP